MTMIGQRENKIEEREEEEEEEDTTREKWRDMKEEGK